MNFVTKIRFYVSYKNSIRSYYSNIKNMKSLTLSQTKDQMPTLGLGTWQAPPDVIESTVLIALDLGYRHIDTAFNYNNEEAIGAAVKKWVAVGKGIREELFITTKLPHVGNRASTVRKFLDLQLSRLQMKYIDLYLIHVPFTFCCDPDKLTPIVKSNGEYVLDEKTNHAETWKPNLIAFGKHCHNCGKWMQRRALRKDVLCNFCLGKILIRNCKQMQLCGRCVECDNIILDNFNYCECCGLETVRQLRITKARKLSNFFQKKTTPVSPKQEQKSLSVKSLAASTVTPDKSQDSSHESLAASTITPDKSQDLFDDFQVMEECKKEGLIRNIGLSNFNESQITKIMETATVVPQVLQIELHAYFQQRELRTFCEKNNIIVTAYAPLGSPGAKEHFVTKYNYSPDVFPDLLGLPIVKEVAENHARTPAQILLNFLVRQNIAVIPKSTSELRLKENMQLYDFEISEQEMIRLRKLDKGEKGRIFNFLFWKGVENHPEYPFKLPEITEVKT